MMTMIMKQTHLHGRQLTELDSGAKRLRDESTLNPRPYMKLFSPRSCRSKSQTPLSPSLKS